MSERDWRDRLVAEADKALEHQLVRDVMAELRENLGVSDTGLPAYGIAKVAHYAAVVARAQAFGFDPDLLRLSNEEATSEQMRLAAELVLKGVPVHMIEVDGDE